MGQQNFGCVTMVGNFASEAELPNVAGAAFQNAALRVGAMARVSGTYYVCVDATLNAASWNAIPFSPAGAFSIHAAVKVTLSGPQTISAADGVGFDSVTYNVGGTRIDCVLSDPIPLEEAASAYFLGIANTTGILVQAGGVVLSGETGVAIRIRDTAGAEAAGSATAVLFRIPGTAAVPIV